MAEHKADQYDAIVIGTGQGGKPLAASLARAGWKMAIIECGDVGGTCVNVGCTPTKTMVASARVAHLARRGPDYGVITGDIRVDMMTVRKRKRNIVNSFRIGSEKGMNRVDGLDLIMGKARFHGERALSVDLNDGGSRDLIADKIFINAGGRPAIPSIDGIDRVQYLDSTSIMELDAVPEHLVVLGGGYIGLEFGQMFRRFGANVTIIQRSDHLLSREDPDVSEAVASVLSEDGIELVLGATVTQAAPDNESDVCLTLDTADGTRTIKGSHLLVATGRRPNSDWLDLDNAGIVTDKRGYITVNEKLETNVPGIFALGDITGGPAFTHIAYDDYRVLRANMLDNANASTANRLIPYTVFIDPQLGRVGMSEAAARAAGRNIRVAKMPMTHVARALETDETRGFMKVVLDSDSNQILGCAILGIEGGEVASVIQMAMMGNVPYTAIRDGVFSHPTLSESLNNLFMGLDG